MGSWDWETPNTDTSHRESTTSLQFLVFLVAIQLKDICRLWIRKGECGAVETMAVGDWGWATQMQHAYSRGLKALGN